jgi:hypothetical protein
MKKRILFILYGLILLSFPFSVPCYYETELTGAILYHEGGDCGCSCTYSWLTFLYSINEATGFYTYSYIETYLGTHATDEKIALFLDTYAKNDKHTVIVFYEENPAWEEIALSIINTERPHIEVITYTYPDPDVRHAILAVAVQTEKDPENLSEDYDLKKVRWYDSRTVGGFNYTEFYTLDDFYDNDYWFLSRTGEYRAVICWSNGSGIDEEKPHNMVLWVKNFNFPSQTTDISYSLQKNSNVDLT